MEDSNRILVSICLITYNHKNYIIQSIESILSQKVNFPIEIIIADDCSTDGTREILKNYKTKFPKKIELILQEKNVGPAKNWLNLIHAAKGKYIAYLEGDDYWTDSLKLQKQFDFMEANKDCELCFHNALVSNEVEGTTEKFVLSPKKEYTGDDLLDTWVIPSASIFYRNPLPEREYPHFFETATHGDLALFLFLAERGKVKFINEVMSVYRVNSGGATQSGLKGICHNLQHIAQMRQMIDYFQDKYRNKLKQRITNYLISTGYLYAKGKHGKETFKYLKEAFSESKLEFFRNIKFVFGCFYFLIKS